MLLRDSIPSIRLVFSLEPILTQCNTRKPLWTICVPLLWSSVNYAIWLTHLFNLTTNWTNDLANYFIRKGTSGTCQPKVERTKYTFLPVATSTIVLNSIQTNDTLCPTPWLGSNKRVQALLRASHIDRKWRAERAGVRRCTMRLAKGYPRNRLLRTCWRALMYWMTLTSILPALQTNRSTKTCRTVEVEPRRTV